MSTGERLPAYATDGKRYVDDAVHLASVDTWNSE